MNGGVPMTSIAITQPLIDEYARLSGDFNPIHVDTALAANSPFGGTVAHGCIPLEPVFKALKHIVGAHVLPAGSRMSLRYLRPSRPGDGISVTIDLKEEEGDQRSFSFACVNQHGERVIEGTCKLPAIETPR